MKRFHICLFALLARSLHLIFHESPPGHDITLLADMVRVYLEHWENGTLIPETWAPIFGAPRFFGFHSLLAPIVALGEWCWQGSLIFLLQFVNVLGFLIYDLAVISLFFAIKHTAKLQNNTNSTIFSALLFTNYLSPFPSRFIGSGGGVFVFSAGLAILALAKAIELINFKQKSLLRQTLLISGLFFISILIHPLSSPYALMLAPFFLLISSRRIGPELLRFEYTRAFAVLGVAVFCSLPVLLTQARPHMEYLFKIQDWIAIIKNSYSMPIPTSEAGLSNQFGKPLQFFAFVAKQFGIQLSLIIFLASTHSVKDFFLNPIAFSTAAGMVWFGTDIPGFGYLFYPDRLSVFLNLMLGIIFFQVIQDVFISQRASMIVMLSVFSILCLSLGRFTWSYLVQASSHDYLSSSDKNVIMQIPELMTEHGLVETRYHSAGVWIPALAGINVSEPHVHISFEHLWHRFKGRMPEAKYGFQSQHCRGDECGICTERGAQILIQKGNSKFCRFKS
ncbi:MAG: hypothetical protein HRU09_07670 [Oligoflexales bacterium]|nr:hypothetical protein [Oligoflexales bacterium]